MRNNSKASPCPKQKRNVTPVLSRSDLWTVWRCHSIPRVFCYYFCLEATVRKDAWMRTTSITVLACFSKVAFWKLLDHSYVQSFFQIITRHIENSILKRHPTVECVLDMDQLTRNIFHQDFGKHETKIDDSPSKKISCTKLQVCTSKSIEPK